MRRFHDTVFWFSDTTRWHCLLYDLYHSHNTWLMKIDWSLFTQAVAGHWIVKVKHPKHRNSTINIELHGKLFIACFVILWYQIDDFIWTHNLMIFMMKMTSQIHKLSKYQFNLIIAQLFSHKRLDLEHFLLWNSIQWSLIESWKNKWCTSPLAYHRLVSPILTRSFLLFSRSLFVCVA